MRSWNTPPTHAPIGVASDKPHFGTLPRAWWGEGEGEERLRVEVRMGARMRARMRVRMRARMRARARVNVKRR